MVKTGDVGPCCVECGESPHEGRCRFGYTVKQLVDAGWAGWEDLQESKKLGVCIPGNNMAMASLARAVLKSLHDDADPTD